MFVVVGDGGGGFDFGVDGGVVFLALVRRKAAAAIAAATASPSAATYRYIN